MIEIVVQSDNTALIWTSQDYHELRSKYHIIGNLIGTRWSVPKNSKILSLPSKLLPEEVTLLLEKNICKLVQIENVRVPHNSVGQTFLDVNKGKIPQEQVTVFEKTNNNITCDIDLKQWSYPKSRRDSLKFLVFKDLWQKNYFITNGTKFGGDYLVYCGDPAQFHAKYIIICKYHNETFKSSELAMVGRIGSNVKKTVVIASITANSQIKYHSLNFLDIVI